MERRKPATRTPTKKRAKSPIEKRGNDNGEWDQGAELEFMKLAAIREATPAKPVVVPDGKGRGHRFIGGERAIW